MAILVRAPKELEDRVRASAEAQGSTLNAWWLDAAEMKMSNDKGAFDEAVEFLKNDPVSRYVLDRLGE
jgi:hypothetical protein